MVDHSASEAFPASGCGAVRVVCLKLGISRQVADIDSFFKFVASLSISG